MEASETSEDISDAGSRWQRMLQSAQDALSQSASYIPEIELLLSKVSTRVKYAHQTVLPTWISSLCREVNAIQKFVTTLDDEGFGEDELKKVGNKLDASCVTLSKGHLQWSILKRCHSLICVAQTFQSTTRASRREQILPDMSSLEKSRLHRTLKEQSRVEVAVVDSGYEWIVIRGISEERLARQMADAGWGWGEHEIGEEVDEEEWDGVLLAKQIQRVVGAARMHRWEYEFPRVRVVLPAIDLRTANEDVSIFLEQLSRLDAHVKVIVCDNSSPFLQTPPPDIDKAMDNLVGNPMESLTQVLNLDHTILIDLISDITHLKIDPQPWQANTTRAQIEDERKHPSGAMVSTLYPLLRGRELVCTKEAAEHFFEVLSTVGTKTEKARGDLLVPMIPPDDPTRIRRSFVALSEHLFPDDIQLPIKVLPETFSDEYIQSLVDLNVLPKVALDIARVGKFKSSKRSIYMHGWATGQVTLTSNKEIRGQIRTWIEANRHDEVEKGPRIWRMDLTRNLLAKSATPPEGWTRARKS